MKGRIRKDSIAHTIKNYKGANSKYNTMFHFYS